MRQLFWLLRLGGKRQSEEHRTRASEERATIYQWAFSQAVGEPGAMGYGAWNNPWQVQQDSSSQAGLLGERREAYRRAVAGGTIPFRRR